MNWGLCFRIAPTKRELEIHEIFTNNIYWVNPNSNLGHETLIATRLGEFSAANKRLQFNFQLFMFMFTSTKRNEEGKRKGEREGEIDRSIWQSPNFQKWHKQMLLISRRKHNVIFKTPKTKRNEPHRRRRTEDESESAKKEEAETHRHYETNNSSNSNTWK